VNSYFAAEPKTGTFANVFTANSSETLQAVGFYTSDLNVPYTISIYKNPTSGPVGGIPAATFSGTLPTMGYNTVVIPVLQQVPVMPGDRFSVVVQVTNPTDNYPIPVEENYPGYIHGIVSQPGQGYAINSSGWTDWKAIVNDSHLCLKAYTSPTPPAAGFTGAPLSGTTPLTVTFTDTSTCIPTSWNWSFGDGTFSTARNPSHTYTATGSYTVSLNATNATPASYYLTRTGYITVNAAPVELNPSGGSDNTPPPLEQGIPGTQTVNVGGMTTVSRVTVPGTDIGDLIVTSSEVSGPGNGVSPPPGIVEEYLEIIASRYSTITGAEIEFSVPQSWLDANHFNPQDIVMMHHAGSGWVALPTTFVRSKDGRVYFTATSPGFSRFAIIGQAASVVQSPAVTPSPTVQISGAITPASVPLATPSTSATSIVPVARNTVAVGTTVPPASVSPPAHGFPLTTIALVGAGCIVLIGSGFLVRRWWIRRQNPALFREYD
jgi:PGF-pre-PGF domain-containing protein